MRDITLGETWDLKFDTTVDGVPTTLAGTPVVSAYVDNSTTEITAGITLTVDFDGRTGLHNVRVVASGGNGYAAGSSYDLVITTGTIGGVTAVGRTIASFSIGREAAYTRLGAPAGASISADIAGVQSDTDNLQTRIPAALVSGRIDASVGAMAANVLTASAINADAITDAKVAADVTIASVTGAVGSVTGAVGSVTGNVGGNVVGSVGSVTGNVGGNVVGSVASVVAGVTLAASAIQAIWDALTSALTTVGSIGKLLVDNINATISSRSSHTAADIWASAARTLTAATNITSTGGTTVPQTGDNYARLGAPVGASISADIATKATPAQVNTEVLDVLVTDTFAEPTSVPAATSSLKDKIAWLFTLGRNKLTQTSTTQKVRNDGDSSDVASSTVSDDGTTFTRGKYS